VSKGHHVNESFGSVQGSHPLTFDGLFWSLCV